MLAAILQLWVLSRELPSLNFQKKETKKTNPILLEQTFHILHLQGFHVIEVPELVTKRARIQ